MQHIGAGGPVARGLCAVQVEHRHIGTVKPGTKVPVELGQFMQFRVVGVLLAQATRLAADGPGRDSLWQMAQVGPRSALGAGDIEWMSEVEAAANFGLAGQLATTPAAHGVKVTVGWVVARDYPARGTTARDYLALRTAADLLDLHGLWGERAEAVRLPQHQARALVRGQRRKGEDVRVVRLWRWVATG